MLARLDFLRLAPDVQPQAPHPTAHRGVKGTRGATAELISPFSADPENFGSLFSRTGTRAVREINILNFQAPPEDNRAPDERESVSP